MSTVPFLAGWAVRSSILILSGALLLRVLRVKDSSIRLAAWVAMLAGSLAIPALTAVLPNLPLTTPRLEPVRPEVVGLTAPPDEAPPVEIPQAAVYEPAAESVPTRFDWALAAFVGYLLIAGALLLRLSAGLAMSLRLLHKSRATELVEIRESDRVAAPVTLGIVRPAIVLPADWREWNRVKLDAVLEHEKSHVRRRDPAVQFVSMIHRALLWFSPLSWFLHKRIVQAAEEASDDAAVAASPDRASYAEVLLDFMRQGVRGSGVVGVPMARYGSPDQRIHRILDETALSRGVTRWSVAAILALGSPLAYVVAAAQPQNIAQLQLPIPRAPLTPVPQAFQASKSVVAGPTFDSVDVHASAPNTMPRMRSAFSRGRYELRNASLVELIQTAWNVDADNVVGGPEWMDKDRFDVIGTAPSGATPETLRAMLRTLLEDRFRLTVRKETRSVPAYAMTVGKNLRLKASETAAGQKGGCTIQAGTLLEPVVFQCRNTTMAGFADYLFTQWPAPDYLYNYRVVDRTGLKGAWDFSFECSRPPNNRPPGGLAPGAVTTLSDAFENQLGLKLTLTKAPTPVAVVESATPPDLTKPFARRLEFEVADIRPDAPGPARSRIEIQPGGRITIWMTLKGLIWEAWGNVNPDRIIGGPKSMDATGWVVLAKAPTQEGPVIGMNGVDYDTMRQMLRSLLIDRFKLEAHTEDRLVDGYALVAAKPKLRKADPSNRPGCKDGPGADGLRAGWKDPRIANPLASKLVTCQNMTLMEFAAALSAWRTEEPAILSLFPPVVDATGIDGRYDMTINFTPPRENPNPANSSAGIASDPDGTVSIFEALPKQLGLKLESRKVMGKVLVVDHVEEKPTDN